MWNEVKGSLCEKKSRDRDSKVLACNGRVEGGG